MNRNITCARKQEFGLSITFAVLSGPDRGLVISLTVLADGREEVADNGAAVRREDGRIRVLGRTEDVVNVRGWKIAVAPLEELIQRRLGVDTVCVFSELDKSGEERIVIALESDRLPPEDKLAAAIQDRTGFERVRWEVLETFPRTEGGTSKVNRRKLRPLVTRSG